MPKGWGTLRDVYELPWCVPWAAGRFYSGSLASGLSTNGAMNANFRACPVYVPNVAGVTVTTIGLELTAAGAGGTKLRLGIYSDKDGCPDELLLDSGQLAADPGSPPTFESAVVSKFLSQGWYWLASLSDGAAVARALTTVSVIELIGWAEPFENSTPRTHIAYTPVTPNDWIANGLPAHFPANLNTGAGLNQVPRVMIGV